MQKNHTTNEIQYSQESVEYWRFILILNPNSEYNMFQVMVNTGTDNFIYEVKLTERSKQEIKNAEQQMKLQAETETPRY